MRHPKMEPYTIVTQVHKHHKMGPLFGVYLQPDIIETKEQYEELFPDYIETHDRPFDKSSVIKVTDSIRLRVRSRWYYLS